MITRPDPPCPDLDENGNPVPISFGERLIASIVAALVVVGVVWVVASAATTENGATEPDEILVESIPGGAQWDTKPDEICLVVETSGHVAGVPCDNLADDTTYPVLGLGPAGKLQTLIGEVEHALTLEDCAKARAYLREAVARAKR